ncbi:MAG: hypothetical protein PHX82_04980 [Paracoccaceae bacterium]|nr:hypothetical protein [Paracoccaceae bacterium]
MPDHQKYEGFSIALPMLFELCDICACDYGALSKVQRIVRWAADHGVLAQPSDQSIKIAIAPGVYPPPPAVYLQDLEERATFETTQTRPVPSSGADSAGEIAEPDEQPQAADAPAFLQPISPVPPSSAGEAPPPCATDPDADASPIASASEAAPAADRKGAPWTEAECRNAKRWRAEGLTARMIAERLGRPLAATQVKLSSLKDSPAAAKAKAPQKVPAAPATKFEAKNDKSTMLGGERGGLQLHVLAEKAPVQAAVSAGAPSAGPAAEAKPAPVAPITARAPTETTRPGWWVELNAQLNALGYRDGWSVARDLELVEGLASGSPAALVADQLGVEVGALKARFIALTPDGVTIEGQTRLLQVLRDRAQGGAK